LVCARWERFENFLADMGPKPIGLTIERIDNNRGYEPGNCCWADRSAQSRNRRQWRKSNVKGYCFLPGRSKPFQAVISFKGKRKSLGYYPTAEEAHAAFEAAK
jgi:hypothetical protein